MPYDCYASDGNAAAILATNLETGDVLGVCPEHILAYCLGMLKEITGTEWVPMGDATDPGTGDATDEPEAGDGPTLPSTPEPATPSPSPAPGPEPADEDELAGAHDQVAEDNAVRDQELRDELTAPRA